MTNLMNTNLTELKSTKLKALAKEYKVKNWWLLNKADLVSALVEVKLDLENKAAVELANKVYQEEKIPQPTTEDPKSEKKDSAKPSNKAKASKVEKDQDNLVTLKELAYEFNMKGTKARRLLRNESAPRPFGSNRWEWDKVLHTEELRKVREILKAHSK